MCCICLYANLGMGACAYARALIPLQVVVCVYACAGAEFACMHFGWVCVLMRVHSSLYMLWCV